MTDLLIIDGLQSRYYLLPTLDDGALYVSEGDEQQ